MQTTPRSRGLMPSQSGPTLSLGARPQQPHARANAFATPAAVFPRPAHTIGHHTYPDACMHTRAHPQAEMHVLDYSTHSSTLIPNLLQYRRDLLTPGGTTHVHTHAHPQT
eukprot:73112-Chlamydomonas_euryale.AAC.1